MVLEKLRRIDETKLELPLDFKQGMRVPGVIYVDSRLEKELEAHAIDQVANVATLPGEIIPEAGQRDTESQPVQREKKLLDLKGDLRFNAVLHPFDIDGFGMNVILILIEVFDEGDDSSLVIEFVFLVSPLIFDADRKAFIQESQLS